jgi:hypothetical protein
MLVGQLLALERRRGMQNPLAAGKGETVPEAVPMHEAGQNVPCGLKADTGGH